ncbi:Ribosome production factor 1 [Elasticomyces elasticus]|nr:Ribosome production factor 1 [Elasticomyces elasticus]KAK4992025.1 Ribosome production factor 1 [Elasticomyces elasticus]
MASSKIVAGSVMPSNVGNKLKRQSLHLKHKKAKESQRRDDRLRRRRVEDKNPQLREERQARNVPQTIDRKRTWDDALGQEADNLGLSIDLQSAKRSKPEGEEEEEEQAVQDGADEKDRNPAEEADSEGDEVDSMLGSDSENDGDANASDDDATSTKRPPIPRAPSPTASTGTNLDLTPESLTSKFPSLFARLEHPPKVLITTTINSTLHAQAQLLTTLFPNASYVRRSAHFRAHKYSVREIAAFASNREYTTLVILTEDQKRPSGLDVVHLPEGPMFHFSISNWVEGAKLPGHGNPTNHYPELILNGFRTPLGLLTAHLFRTLFPPQPEFQGRQVVTLHNQRDYIFVRRHRYVFRDKRGTEKSIVGADGKPVKGAEEIRAGLQELGPRFTLKLRRVDKGIQRRSGQEWEWKAGSEKVRTRFQL